MKMLCPFTCAPIPVPAVALRYTVTSNGNGFTKGSPLAGIAGAVSVPSPFTPRTPEMSRRPAELGIGKLGQFQNAPLLTLIREVPLWIIAAAGAGEYAEISPPAIRFVKLYPISVSEASDCTATVQESKSKLLSVPPPTPDFSQTPHFAMKVKNP